MAKRVSVLSSGGPDHVECMHYLHVSHVGGRIENNTLLMLLWTQANDSSWRGRILWFGEYQKISCVSFFQASQSCLFSKYLCLVKGWFTQLRCQLSRGEERGNIHIH